MEIRALKVFDSKEDCGNFIPKIFEKITKLSGLSKEQVHVLVGPVGPLHIGVNGAIKGWCFWGKKTNKKLMKMIV